jgi:hypothetical protein
MNASFPYGPATACQRWTRRRMSFRPAGELFNPDRHEVVLLNDTDAKAFCAAHHYASAMPPARLRVGLMRKMAFSADALVGLAVFSVPMQNAVLEKYLKADMETGAELGRFVCTEAVEGNGESWLIRAACRLLQRETKIRSIVSYCDPVPRVDEFGNITKFGHLGTIYQAVSAKLLGRSSPRTLVLSRSGQVISERALSKICAGDSGAAYAYRQLLAAGAPEREWGEEPGDYVRRALSSDAFTRIRHPGNYVYGMGCGNKLERRLVSTRMGPGLPYPKAQPASVASGNERTSANLGLNVFAA